MFIAVYEFEINDGMEEIKNLGIMDEADSRHLHECGSLGSRLHRSEKENAYVQ